MYTMLEKIRYCIIFPRQNVSMLLKNCIIEVENAICTS